MNRTEKAAEIQRLEAEFQKTENAFLVSLAGLKVAQVMELRRQIRSTSSKCRVIKNTLAELAASKTALKDFTKDLKGPAAIAYTYAKDPSSLAKVIHAFSKANPKMGIRAGFVQGKIVVPEKIVEISMLPSRGELLSKLAFLLAQPIARFGMVLAAPLQQMGTVLGQVMDKRGSA